MSDSDLRSTRYQAAIVRDDHLLMLKVWDHASRGNDSG
jgi:hypothetical protein